MVGGKEVAAAVVVHVSLKIERSQVQEGRKVKAAD